MFEGYNIGWHKIGLSRNGREPIEYIWRVGEEPHSYAIMNAEIGDKGTIYLSDFGRQNRIKLPRPNADNPSVIGTRGDIYWKKSGFLSYNKTIKLN